MPIIAVSNQKGGVGKTATAANLGAALAEAGKRVLLVDLDAQANLTLSLGVSVGAGQVTAYEVLMDGKAGLAEAVVETGFAGLDVLPASEALAAAQVQLASARGRNERLKGKLEGVTAEGGRQRRRDRNVARTTAEGTAEGGRQRRRDKNVAPTTAEEEADGDDRRGTSPRPTERQRPAGDEPPPYKTAEAGAARVRAPQAGYEYVVIDTPPSLGFLTLNALTAADWVLIPVQASFLALHGLRQLMQTVESVREHSNPGLRVGGVLVTMYDGRTLHARQVVERLREHFHEILFETMIRRSVAFDYATVAGSPLVLYQPGHPCAAQYRELAEEVMTRA